MALRITRAELAEANAYVAKHHAHHEPVQGHKFSLACYDGARLCGVAIVGRPPGRASDDGTRLELTRCCTDKTPHVASKLIGAVARAVFALGYGEVISYVLEEEAGVSYRAAGWTRLEENGEPVKCGLPQGALGWNSRPRTEPLAGALTLKAKHVGGYKHRWFRRAPGHAAASEKGTPHGK